MSTSDLLLECQWWASDAVNVPRRKTSDATRWGLAFHAGMANALTLSTTIEAACVEPAATFNVDDVPALVSSVEAAHKVLSTWLTKDGNPFGVDFTPQKTRSVRRFIEASVAWNVPGRTVRFCASPSEDTHDYPDRRPGDFCGTLDFGVTRRSDRRSGGPIVLVLDYKTGDAPDLHRPERLRQLKSLLYALREAVRGTGRMFIGTLHAPPDGAPSVYAHEVTEGELSEHVALVEAAWATRNSGYLRPGTHCLDKYCEAYAVCPSQSGNLVELRGKAAGALTTPAAVGLAHQKLTEWRRTFERLGDAIAAEIRAGVEAFGPCPGTDGKVSELQPRKGSVTISQSSIDAAVKLARLGGEHERADAILKMAAKLRALGAYSESAPTTALVRK